MALHCFTFHLVISYASANVISLFFFYIFFLSPVKLNMLFKFKACICARSVLLCRCRIWWSDFDLNIDDNWIYVAKRGNKQSHLINSLLLAQFSTIKCVTQMLSSRQCSINFEDNKKKRPIVHCDCDCAHTQCVKIANERRTKKKRHRNNDSF